MNGIWVLDQIVRLIARERGHGNVRLEWHVLHRRAAELVLEYVGRPCEPVLDVALAQPKALHTLVPA